MDQSFVPNFVEHLIRMTINRTINWLPITSSTTFGDSKAYDILGEHEFYMVNYTKSYYLSVDGGTVFLVYALAEDASGEGSDSEGYSLYIQPRKNAPLTTIMGDSPALYRLKNAIEENLELPRDVTDFMQYLMDS